MNEHTNPSNPKHTGHEQHMERQGVRFEEPKDRAVEHHHHYYYAESKGSGLEAGTGAKTAPERKVWYNQGWMWLIVAVIGIGVLIVGMTLLSDRIGGVGEAVKEQTGAIREQTGVLNSIQRSLNEMSAGLSSSMKDISEGIASIEKAIREGIQTLLSVFK
ncbi:hypothetical protein RAC89_11415 [Paenibacillus sp. GD4]|jgi:Sec-independent protein translocase protein TatA|uniref:hypothetical protein n=1 Tax=Paenibacillus sp. GD4 TaxID=3068890 RepID=UPI002796596E|nr:hypothetical protein [Paenibacillus sp. GD4]MDQ1911059.1 hypothetical protein [Paenibacillus sp. GD4]